MLEEVENENAVPSGPPEWEYMMVADRGRMSHIDMDQLNTLGRDGWELITIIEEKRTQTPELQFYFKRRVV